MFSLQTITTAAKQIKTKIQETSFDTETLKAKTLEIAEVARTKFVTYAVLLVVFLYVQACALWTTKSKIQEKIEALLAQYDVQAKAAKVDEKYLKSTFATIVKQVKEAVEPKQEQEEQEQEQVEEEVAPEEIANVDPFADDDDFGLAVSTPTMKEVPVNLPRFNKVWKRRDILARVSPAGDRGLMTPGSAGSQRSKFAGANTAVAPGTPIRRRFVSFMCEIDAENVSSQE